jgi:uncharacterized protein (TIRG00374 family)
MIRFALKAVCTAGLLWLLLEQIDAAAAAQQILEIRSYPLTGALILLFSMSVPGAARWTVVLRVVDFPLRFLRTWPILLVASFFNHALPSTMGGDIVRMAQCYRIGIPLKIAISNVVIDRLTSFASLMVLVTMTLPIIFFIIRDTSEWWIAPAFVGIGFAGIYLLMSLKHIPMRVKRWRFVGTTISVSEHLSKVLLDGRWWPKVMAAGLAVHLMRVVAVWMLADGLRIDASLIDCVALVPLALLVTIIPISLGGWGLREGAFLVAFGLVGVTPGDAVVLSITFGITSIVASLPGGLIWLFNTDVRQSVNKDWRTVKQESTQRTQI